MICTLRLVGLWILLLAAASAFADDLSLAIRAQTDFDRIMLSPIPKLQDIIACEQSQAAVLPIVAANELSLVHYRKGLCSLLTGALTGHQPDFESAGGEFQKAIEARPASVKEPVPVSSALRILLAISRLEGRPGPEALSRLESELAGAVSQPECPAILMPANRCQALIDTGRLWLGWIAYRQNRLAEAAQILQSFPESGWHFWVLGRQAFASRRYSEAAPLLQKAVQIWSDAQKYSQPGIPELLGPQAEMAQAQYELAIAQFLSGDYRSAVGSFDAAVKVRPANAHSIFLRGRAKELLGSSQAALADYELASRTAFANVNEPFAAGEAHYYRGLWLFRRKEPGRAETEFASALNFDPGAALRPDVTAWWRMVAVARGACQASASYLEKSLVSVSGFFPKEEAEALLETCRAGSQTTASPRHPDVLQCRVRWHPEALIK